MDTLSSKQIRDKFLSFFQSKDHLLISDSSIIPKNDPTLLFINSGMAPIKSFFTGEEKPKSPRLCNIQPCIRTIDIDEIGDKHHLTSFQMLGSWSIGDYFKEKAISLAFEFLTSGLGIPVEKLYATVFSGDESMGLSKDEDAIKYWEKVGMPKDHIVPCGKEDNFWGPTSNVGPCGPCTEVFYDTGVGTPYTVGKEFDTKSRYIEIWNAGVFMQFNKNSDGSYDKLSFTSVDTGAGLERLAMVLGGNTSVYETDLLKPIKDTIFRLLGDNTVLSEREMRILTDHLRTVSLILSEGVKPSNEGRGYIPRKLLRKCMMILNTHNAKNFDITQVVNFILNTYSDIYPLFADNHDDILLKVSEECNQFNRTLQKGIERLETIKNKGNFIDGIEAFDLVTTYGLPFDIVKEYAKNWNMTVDEKSFEQKLAVHKEISKKASGGSQSEQNIINLSELNTYAATEFVGYDENECNAYFKAIFKENIRLDSDPMIALKLGDKISFVLDKTCMYAESGGQCADTGEIRGDCIKIKVNDVKKTKQNVYLHFGVVEKVDVSKAGDILQLPVKVSINTPRRRKLEINHSCVHLLHSALRKILGTNVHQCGSKVEENLFRFDFNYETSLDENTVFEIEKLVNTYVRSNLERKVELKSLSDAVKEGAMALFENKYSDKVRVVTFGDISKELCGGTHTQMTGNIGMVSIISTESIGKGIKRITGVCGENAIEYNQKQMRILRSISKILKVKPEQIEDKIQKVMAQHSGKEATSEKILLKDSKWLRNDDLKIAYIIKQDYVKSFTEDSITIANNINGIFVCMAGQDKKRLILAVGADAKTEFNAVSLLKLINDNLGGKGGGNERIASGCVECDYSKVLDFLKTNIC